jgi:hypothetical protein
MFGLNGVCDGCCVCDVRVRGFSWTVIYFVVFRPSIYLKPSLHRSDSASLSMF